MVRNEQTHSPAHPLLEFFRVFGVFGVFDAFGANTPGAGSATVDLMRQDRRNGRTKSGSEFRVVWWDEAVVWWGEATDEPGLPKLRGYGSARMLAPTAQPSSEFRVPASRLFGTRHSKPSQPGFTCAANSRQVSPTLAMASKKEFTSLGGIHATIYLREKFCSLAQILATKERKEHTSNSLCLCVLFVLLWQSSLIAASAALCSFAVSYCMDGAEGGTPSEDGRLPLDTYVRSASTATVLAASCSRRAHNLCLHQGRQADKRFRYVVLCL